MSLDTVHPGTARRATPIRLLVSVLALVALLAAVAACDGVGNDFEGEVTTVTVGFEGSTALIVDQTVTVEAFVFDNLETAVPGVTVRWSVTEGTLSSQTSVTGSGGEGLGRATVEWTLGTTAAEQEITAVIEGAEGVTASVASPVSTGPVGDVEAALDRDSLLVGQTTVLRVTRVEDIFGNEVPPGDYNRYGINFFSLDTLVARVVASPENGGDGARTGIEGVGEGEALLAVTAAAAPPGRRGFRLAEGSAADTVSVSVVSFISGGPFLAATISAGEGFSCGIDMEGAAFCWGANATGQLGVGDFEPRLVPTRVTLPGPAASISAGGSHTCALLESGQVFCWGEAFLGRLGNGTDENELFPEPVLAQFPGDAGEVVEVQAGETATCARTTDGEIYCWGFDGVGTVGNGAPPEPTEDDVLDIRVNVPTRVNTPSGVRFASLGSSIAEHTCAVAEDGAAYCWGKNAQEFRLGNGFSTIQLSPEPVRVQPTNVAFRAVAAHAIASSGLGADGQLYGWGDPSVPDPSASGLTMQVFQATPVEPREPFVALAGGGGVHACALTSVGAASCWGSNFRGKLGTGDTTDTVTPIPVATDLRFESIEVSFSHSCAVVEGGGEAYCWGANEFGQHGTGGTQTAVLTPTRVETEPDDAPRSAFGSNAIAHRRAWCAAIPDRLRRSTSVCGASLFR